MPHPIRVPLRRLPSVVPREASPPRYLSVSPPDIVSNNRFVVRRGSSFTTQKSQTTLPCGHEVIAITNEYTNETRFEKPDEDWKKIGESYLPVGLTAGATGALLTGAAVPVVAGACCTLPIVMVGSGIALLGGCALGSVAVSSKVIYDLCVSEREYYNVQTGLDGDYKSLKDEFKEVFVELGDFITETLHIRKESRGEVQTQSSIHTEKCSPSQRRRMMRQYSREVSGTFPTCPYCLSCRSPPPEYDAKAIDFLPPPAYDDEPEPIEL